ncbi:MAG: gliding motility lipoprotein GldH [Flavobacterium sp. BFFFF1]|uniref:gliding motility lipoprotein GldH n=1 Tax=Flavobacterium sp. BFFFF1 TaxID=2015557 RepID=UPI000BD803BC|nr:gliding motility lipoprotein GldH [Flavobacterium sp. BFFFF1]OYU80977.1 MAG: gliding motility lipoprotein GldH [Flavobacterium sp. BFFFF1]
MSLKNSLFLLSVTLLLVSCDKKRVFDEYKSVGSSWQKDSVVTFKFNSPDTTKPYNLYVNIRDNNDYQFSNLFLIVALEQPGGLTKVDTLQYKMTEADGTLLGDGFTDIKENKLFYKEKMKFAKTGEYKVSIKHAVRQTGKIPGIAQLAGITDVGFRIESTE